MSAWSDYGLKLLAAAVVLALLGLALLSIRPRRCPRCGKRAVQRSEGCCCGRQDSCTGTEYVCGHCGATFATEAEVRGGSRE